MIIFHAGFCERQLWLWGETAAKTEPVAAARPKRKAKAQTMATLPYDAGSAGLLAALSEVVAGLAIDEDDLVSANVWLPTVNGQPLASSPLIAEQTSADAQAPLAPWAVTALPLNIIEMVDLLSACMGRELLAPGVLIGRDLACWATALRWGGALVARQQFLPGVAASEDSYRAQWTPVLAGADAQRLAQLAQAMPAAGRALSKAVDAAPDAPALTVLTDFLGLAVDHLVRSGLAQAASAASYIGPASKRAKQPSFESLHEQWLHALRAENGLLKGAAAELQQLAEQVREWQRPIAVSTAAPFRLCFRLEEPADGAETNKQKARAAAWQVRYLLQATDDPSLLVPVADAWNPKGRAATALKRGVFQPREYLLAALGQAASFSPRIEQSLKAAAPGGYDLDATGAHEFLSEKAWLLEQAGFGVLLPAWWTRKGTKLRLSVRANVKAPKMQGGSGLSLEEIVQFDWEVALGEQTLSLKELEALAKLKAPLVQVRGQWVELNADEIQAALDFWKKKATDKATAREVMQMALGRARTPGGLDFGGVAATGWIGDLLAQLEGREGFAELVCPQNSRARCGLIRCAAIRGWHSCGAGAWARVWRTIWVWVRRRPHWRTWNANGRPMGNSRP